MRLLIAALATLAVPAGAHATAPAGFYGTSWDREVAAAPDNVQEAAFRRMRAIGVETVRASFPWDLAQPEENAEFDHSYTDDLVARASRHGLQLLPIVIIAPRWARVSGATFAPPRRPSEYAAYLTALVERYGPAGSFWTERPELPRLPIGAWQIWNEPHLQYQWTVDPPGDWAQSYASLLRAADRAVESADPNALVVLGGLTNRSPRHLRKLYRAGVEGDFDVGAIHPYTRRPRNVLELVMRFRRVMRTNGDGRKGLWATEVGLPASEGRAGSDSPLQTTDGGMARFLTKTFGLLGRTASDREAGVTRAYWHTWASSYEPSGGIFEFAGLNKFVDGELRARPALAAYREAARRRAAG